MRLTMYSLRNPGSRSVRAARCMGVLACFCVSASATPQVLEPSRAPASWELKYSFSDPQRIALTLPGATQPTTYWYMLYTVENDTNRDVPFYATAELVTASLQVIKGG